MSRTCCWTTHNVGLHQKRRDIWSHGNDRAGDPRSSGGCRWGSVSRFSRVLVKVQYQGNLKDPTFDPEGYPSGRPYFRGLPKTTKMTLCIQDNIMHCIFIKVYHLCLQHSYISVFMRVYIIRTLQLSLKNFYFFYMCMSKYLLQMTVNIWFGPNLPLQFTLMFFGNRFRCIALTHRWTLFNFMLKYFKTFSGKDNTFIQIFLNISILPPYVKKCWVTV